MDEIINPQIFLNPCGAWLSNKNYKIQSIPSAIQVGLNLISAPMVIDKGSTFYATGSTQPTLGTPPAADTAWTLITPGLTIHTTAPAVGNDKTQGYVVGASWLNTTNGNYYVCTDNTTGAAVWTLTA